jgi:NAD(P)-dependent dehydrogenase (short-subunit alcohol dehydrogenase family)
MRFDGKHIIVTGASLGIGKATAIRLASEGARLTLLARNDDTLQALIMEIGPLATGISVDVSDKAKLLAALDQAISQSGPVDGVFLNAGYAGPVVPLLQQQDETVDDIIRLNLLSPFWAIRRLAPDMVARKRGSILITGSIASVRGNMNSVGYCMSKHGVLGLMDSVALELAPHGVRCNAVLPGFIETPMLATMPEEALSLMALRTPMQRLGRPEELAAVAAFLLSDDSSFVTAQALSADGGILGTLML